MKNPVKFLMGLLFLLSSLTVQAEQVCEPIPFNPYFYCYETDPPPAPSSISSSSSNVTHAYSGSWTISWPAASTATYYELREKFNSSEEVKVYTGANRSFQVQGKTLAGTYKYRVRACNQAGCSNDTSYKTVSLTIGSPTTLAFDNIDANFRDRDGAYTVKWAAKTPVMGVYRLEQKVGTSESWSNERNAYTYTSKPYSEKSNGDYEYRMRWIFNFNLGSMGGWIYVDQKEIPQKITVRHPPPKPNTPTLTNQDGYSDLNFNISWNAVGGNVNYYQLIRRKANYGTSTWSGWTWFTFTRPSASGPIPTSHAESNLADGHYQYYVRSCNNYSFCGDWSAARTVNVLRKPGTIGTFWIEGKTANTDPTYAPKWNPSSGRITYYKLYRRTASYGSSSYSGYSNFVNPTATSQTESNKADGHYQYYVRACNEAGCSGNSVVRTATVLRKPGPPGKPTFTAKANNADPHFVVNWTASSGISNNYRVFYRRANYTTGTPSYSGSWTPSALLPTSPRTLNQSRTTDGHYQYFIRAYNDSGWVNSAYAYTTILKKPGVPGGVTFSGNSHGIRDIDGNYSVHWGVATGTVARYQLLRKNAAYASSTYSTWSTVYNGANRSFTETNKPDGHYKYLVRACNADNVCSAYTPEKRQDVLRTPAKPTHISGPADSDGRFVLSIGYGTGYITSYKIQDSVNGGSSWRNKETGSGKPTSLSLTRQAYDANGNPQENYIFRIAACNASGCSAYSASSNNVHVNPPGTPDAISLANVSHNTADADGNFRLQWSAVTVSGVHYTVEEKRGSGAWSTLATRVNNPYLNLTKTVEDLYNYRVTACLDVVGCGDTTNTVTVRVAFMPGVVAQPTISSSHSSTTANTSINGSFSLNWLKPSGTVTHYKLYKNNSEIHSQLSTTSKAFNNQPDGNPSYKVQACNHAVCSNNSSARQIQLLRTPGIPQVQGPSTSDGSGSFNLNWAAPSGSVSHYETRQGNAAWQDNGNSRTLMLNNLDDGSYSYTVRACNSLSCSAASTAKAVTVYNAPSAPGDIHGPLSSNNGNFNVSWAAATGNVSEYQLEQQIDDGLWQTIQTSSATSASFSNKDNGNYRYQVTACNGPNCGSATPVHEVQVLKPEPIAANPLDSVSAYSVPGSDSGIGATGGSHEVSSDGSANYSISIPAAGGRGGLTPQLSLAYNSNGGNTELGVGWNIGGLSLIHRCSSNYALDGEVNGVNFDNNDKLCMDGQRLVSTSGAYGANGTEYRTLRNSFSKIESIGVEGTLASTDGSGSDNGFRVHTRDGRILYLGTTPDSRLSRSITTEHCINSVPINFDLIGGIGTGEICTEYESTTATQTYQWMVSRIEDRQGNSIHFDYDNDDSTGEQRLSEVRYNDNLHRIGFEWEERSDKSQAYFAGALLNQSQRLSKVVSYSDSTALRSLHIDYQHGGSTQHSKIEQITECPGASLGSECLSPTTFDWQLGQAGYSNQPSNISSFNYNENRVPWAMDINGDGYSDIISNADSTWKVALGSADTLSDWHITSTAITGEDRSYALSLRYNNDLRDDLLVERHGYWYVLLADAGSPNFLPAQNTGIPNTGYKKQPKIMDINGDGRGDLVYRGSNGHWFYRLMTDSGFAGANDTGLSSYGDTARGNTLTMDVNGDGLQDLLVPLSSYYLAYISTGSGFREVPTTLSGVDRERGAKPIDLNGDGLTDLLFRNSSSQIVYVLNTGDGFTARTTVPGITANNSEWKRGRNLDYNADGRSELWLKNKLIAMDNTGTVSAIDASAHISGTLPANRHAVVLDYNGDSLDDVVVLGSGSGQNYRYTHNGQRPDYLTSITNGFGVETTFSYRGLHESGAAGFYQQNGDSTYPLLAENSTVYAVEQLTQSDGIGGAHSTNYKYEGLRTHIAGLGSLGFQLMTTINNDTGIRTEVSYSHDYSNHKQGTVTEVKTIAPNNAVLSLTRNHWATKWQDQSAPGIEGQLHHIDLSQTTVIKKDLNDAFLHREVNDYSYDNYSNPLTLTSRVYNAETGGAVMRTSVTTNSWKTPDTTNWLLGLLSRAEVEVTDHSQSAPPLKRISTFEYHSSTGRKLAEQILNPQGGAVLHETRYGEDINGTLQQDSFGNLLATTIKGPDFADRSQSVVYDSAYGLYPIQSRDAQNNLTQHNYYGANEFGSGAYPGKLRLSTAPNGLQTFYKYDSLGRPSETISAYGTAAAVSSYSIFRDCDSSCPNNGNAAYLHTTYTEGGTPVHKAIDKLGRTLRTISLAMDGREVRVDSEFDHLGHNVGVSEPYFAGGNILFNEIDYDILGRPVSSTETSDREDTVEHNGLVSISRIDIYGKNQRKVETRDALNNLLAVTDNNNQTISYHYDSLGRQTEVLDPSGNSTTITYNALGHKTAMSDPDKGNWSYTYNGLGQLITQTNAKGETTCMAYDTLGRMVKRVDNYTGSKATSLGQNAQANQQCSGNGGDVSTWTYNSTGNGLGQLASASSPEYFESHGYDSLGRATQTTTVIKGESFTVNTSYDNYSRPDVLSYPSSSGSHARLEVKQRYNNLGYNTGTYNLDGSILYSRPEAIDARGNITTQLHGNSVTTDKVYNQTTGYLESIGSHSLLELVSGDPAVQDITVDFDLVGNLVYRSDAAIGFYESYTYDNLNRLSDAWSDYGSGSSQHTEVEYDALGNITYKSRVGPIPMAPKKQDAIECLAPTQ
ncbi:FG-GAP-like repeat-containing protein [Oceanicoccus sagamiensis]|uniref:Fibronectin type-III domain-containing protein n=1 Tax=Oceanicoccus sagamiensis TaxID=716816 RepID=A0A1X9N8A3_9GAMM|nr:FG-GAP-like repeat-containing protein [Oceanicoccus sagamiensis]ARN72662.1 hypothetical protein BST96_00145 [Oceanicoccus sagamiensis]